MMAVIQRVRHAAVTADGVDRGACGAGLLLLLGVGAGDTEEDATLLADKIVKLRIFCDEAGKMNSSLLDVGGEALVVSNFTLCADYTHGNRPDYFAAARPEVAEPLYEFFLDRIKSNGINAGSGKFGADMQIEMTADGPVTIVMDSQKLKRGKH